MKVLDILENETYESAKSRILGQKNALNTAFIELYDQFRDDVKTHPSNIETFGSTWAWVRNYEKNLLNNAEIGNEKYGVLIASSILRNYAKLV